MSDILYIFQITKNFEIVYFVIYLFSRPPPLAMPNQQPCLDCAFLAPSGVYFANLSFSYLAMSSFL